jgi:hypothetical protein
LNDSSLAIDSSFLKEELAKNGGDAAALIKSIAFSFYFIEL